MARFSSLRARLLLLVLLAILPALALILSSAAERRRHEAAEVQEDLLRLARLAAVEHARMIDWSRQFLMSLPYLPSVARQDSRTCNALFSNILKNYPAYTNVAAASPTGEVFCSRRPLTHPVSLRDRPYFRRVLETRAFTVS